MTGLSKITRTVVERGQFDASSTANLPDVALQITTHAGPDLSNKKKDKGHLIRKKRTPKADTAVHSTNEDHSLLW